jgi:hypothetical protein
VRGRAELVAVRVHDDCDPGHLEAGAAEDQRAPVDVHRVGQEVGPAGVALLREDERHREHVGAPLDREASGVACLEVDALRALDRRPRVAAEDVHEDVGVEVDERVGEGARDAEEDRAVRGGRGVCAEVVL